MRPAQAADLPVLLRPMGMMDLMHQPVQQATMEVSLLFRQYLMQFCRGPILSLRKLIL